MKHFETKFASTDFKVNFLNFKKIKKFFKRKIDLLKNWFDTLICQKKVIFVLGLHPKMTKNGS